MYQDNLFALDLSKKSIQGALFDRSHQVRLNRTFSPKQLTNWLSRQQPLTVAMEACATAHHWCRNDDLLSVIARAAKQSLGTRPNIQEIPASLSLLPMTRLRLYSWSGIRRHSSPGRQSLEFDENFTSD